jgi:UDP-N-acetylmuramate dehydrogenase
LKPPWGDGVIFRKTWLIFCEIKKKQNSVDMKSLINFVKKKVKDKTGVKLELENCIG